MTKVNIKDNYRKVRESIDEKVLLLAVSKTHSPDEINEAIAAGATDIGENKVQEILDKYDAVDPVRWHMIGHLQTNKVKYIIDKVSLIHSVDSIKLASEINKRAALHDIKMNVLIQINSAGEENKYGVSYEEVRPLIEEILEKCPNIIISGLMCVVPIADDPEEVRNYFSAARKLYEDIKEEITHENLQFEYLSMGMSHDYEVAIEEGSNLVRVGTAIFGPRNYSL